MADRIDSRDLVDRLAELEVDDDDELSAEEEGERAQLRKVVEELEENCDEAPRYGITMIPEGDFKEYAQELAEDCGLLEKEVSWPHTCIDWERAADELTVDYAKVEYNGVTYLCR